MEEKVIVIALSDWQRVLAKMDFYRRKDGYVDFDRDGVFTFFDTDPQIDGVSACYVTREDVVNNIKEYK